MANDGRCDCGSRIFFDKDLRITTHLGAAFSIPGVQIVECVNCRRISKIVGGDGERKTVIPFPVGMEAEKDLFLHALESSKVEHDKAPNSHYILIEEQDYKDFQRLGIPKPEKETV